MEDRRSKRQNIRRDELADKKMLYQRSLFLHIPLYTTRLVREAVFTFPAREQVCSPQDIAAVLGEYYANRDREEFLVCMLDTANTLIAMSLVSVGGLAASIVEARQVFKVAILSNAAAIILAHNHPSGNPEPSPKDIQITRQLVAAGNLMGIPVHDHLIIVDHGFVSMAERGFI